MSYKILKEWMTEVGLPAKAIFINGHINGYVGVSKTSFLFGKDYGDHALQSITVHGGLTYSDDYLTDRTDIWWFGFDTAHYNDANDYALWRELFPEDKHQINLLEKADVHSPEATIKTLDYVIEECENLADQLVRLENIKWESEK